MADFYFNPCDRCKIVAVSPSVEHLEVIFYFSFLSTRWSQLFIALLTVETLALEPLSAFIFATESLELEAIFKIYRLSDL